MVNLKDDEVGGPASYHEVTGIVEIPSFSGMCRFRFEANRSTGPTGSDTSPGVAIRVHLTRKVYDLMARHPSKDVDGTEIIVSGGVVGRSGILLLYRMLGKFLRENGLLNKDDR
jgi:hypothetical protein